MIRLSTTFILVLLVSLVFSQTESYTIDPILEQNQKKLQLSDEDLLSYEIADVYTSKQTQITHVYLAQKYKDIKVFNGILNLNIKEEKLLSFGNRWIYNLVILNPSNEPLINAQTAVNISAEHLGQSPSNPILLSSQKNSFDQETSFTFKEDSLAREEIIVDLVWLATGSDSVTLCWVVKLYERHAENIWNIFIDAHTGAFIKKNNQVIQCSFDPNYGEKRHLQPARHLDCISNANSTDSAYKVFPLTIESPNHGDREVVITPWVNAGPGSEATTLQWHDDGTNNYTITRGNNVHAYEDINNTNTPGFSPDTANLQFDYPFDPALPPADNKSAAITNLFYWNNILHDVMYVYGFDEVSGNFQTDNLGRGGSGGDYVRAEGLDGGGTNNANFFTPSDGSRPRMQMYLWSAVTDESPLYINTPESIEGEMDAVESNFSANNKLEDIGLTTGDLVLVDDDGEVTHLACGELSNEEDISGKIALIDRGNCNFTVKVKKVQDLGAIAAIVINNVAGSPFAMGGSDNSITIPAVMIGLNDGNVLKAILDTSVINASLDEIGDGIIPDGDYDSGIIAHEYGHGISNRLTGGPSAVNCLNNEEQMGEGWSDYFGLMLTTDWSTAQSEDRRGIGTYVLGEPTEGNGIRTYPYTTDMSINPFTYGDVENAPGTSSNPSPHYVGSIWSTMLWDMTWSIIDMAGVDPDIYNGIGGNNIALSLVMNGLKLQPCNPGFVDGRDAILLADEVLYNGQYKCAIWQAFANRGLGVSADQGDSDNYEDGVEAFDTPDGIRIESSPSLSDVTEGQEVTFTVKTICGCTAKSDLDIKDRLSENLIYIPGSGGTLNGDFVEFSSDTLEVQDTLIFSYRAFVGACSATDSSDLIEDDAEGPDQFISIQLSGSGTNEWVKNSSEFVSPSNSWYAQDYTTLSDYALTLNTGIITPGPVEISFKHRYETEDDYDGGVVEYSLDNGITWVDAGEFFMENGYPASISITGTDSPIAGQEAFTGNSNEQFSTTNFLESKIWLFYPGDQELKIRFRFVTDGGTGGSGINGWYIDDILIRKISGITNTSLLYTESILLDSVAYGLGTAAFEGSVVYVDQGAEGASNGIDWPGAIRYLPIALEVAGCRDIDSIFIAQGDYVPNLTNDRTVSFPVPDSVLIFGGFPTGGSDFELRDPEANTTLLSGDIGIPNDTSDNVFHLVQIGSDQKSISIDGVTMSNANAGGTGGNGRGAAIFCEGNLTLDRVKIQANYGKFDGQIITNQGQSAFLTLKNCLIHTPEGILIPLLNYDSGEVSILGATQIIQD